jgi:hypothetical protein
VTTFRFFGLGQRLNNWQKETSEISRAEREADAIQNCSEYIPALVAGYSKLESPAHLGAWANFEPKNEWKPIV